jgi:hypothetical protein
MFVTEFIHIFEQMNTTLTIEQDEANSKLLALGVALREALATAQSGVALFILWVAFYLLFRLIAADMRNKLQQEITINAMNYAYFKKKYEQLHDLLKEPNVSKKVTLSQLPLWQRWLFDRLLNKIENLLQFAHLYQQKISTALLATDQQVNNRIADLVQNLHQPINSQNYHFNPQLVIGRLEVAETPEDIISQITK